MKTFIAVFLSAAMFFAGTAQAMEIEQYDKMADQDQNEYVADLVIGTEKVLTDEGRPDLAEQVRKLFTETQPADMVPAGLAVFDINLALARISDARNVAKDPNTTRIAVEDAMAVTLQKYHIEVPDSFFTVAKDFHPKLPPPQKKK